MYFRRFATGLLIVSSTLVLQAFGAITPVPDLDQLTNDSTLIVIGELVSIQQNVGTASIEYANTQVRVQVNRATLRIDQVLKGDPQPSTTFSYEFVVQMPGTIGLGFAYPNERAYGMFFFTSQSGKLVVTDRYNPFIATVRQTPISGETAIDRVVSMLHAVLFAPDSTQNEKQQALLYLQLSRSDAATAALHATLEHSDPGLSLVAATGLLRRGDGAGIGVLKQRFLPGPGALPESYQEMVGNSLMIVPLRDPAWIPDLEELLGSTSVGLRRGAAGALMRLSRSPTALNGLLRAIEDSDFQVRLYAAKGLADGTGQREWRPSDEAFKADQAKFISHWREWSLDRR